jgi:hypothetical protein
MEGPGGGLRVDLAAMAGARVSIQRLVPANREAPPSPSTGRRFEGARVVDDSMSLRRRGVGQILDTSMDVLVARFGVFVGIGALCWLPFKIGSELLWYSGADDVTRLLWTATTVAPQLLTTSFVCSLVGAHLLRREMSLGEALKIGFTRFPGMVLIALLNIVVAVLMLCPCVITSYASYWLFAVIPAVYVLEREGLKSRNWLAQVGAALVRGFQLVWGWDSFARWLGWVTVAVIAITGPLGSIPGLIDVPQVREFLDQQLGAQGSGVEFMIAAVGSVFVGIGTAYMAVLMTVYYLDQRVRREGLDLELRLEQLTARHAEATD